MKNFIIPCRSIPMPYYTTPPSYTDYSILPMTYECVEGTATVSLPLYYQGNTSQPDSSAWGGSNSPITSMFYRKYDGSDWGEWVNWKTANFAAVTLTQGQKIELSGANGGNISKPWSNINPQYFNKFAFGGSGKLSLYGNISSIFASSVTDFFMSNMWYDYGNGSYNLVDASKFVVPYNANNLQSFGMFSNNRALTGGPIFLSKTYYNHYVTTNVWYNAWVGCFGNTSLQYLEVCYESTNTWHQMNCFLNVTTSGMFIKSPESPNPPKGDVSINSRTSNYIPNAWIILNRMSDGSLQVAENTTWRGRSYTSGQSWGNNEDEYDPYAWYYYFHSVN